MAGSVNKVILVGRLGRDPELKYTPNGTATCSFSLATDDDYTDRDGQKVERTEWHNVVFFDKSAEIAHQYLKKGALVYIEGTIRSREYTDKENINRKFYEIRGHKMQMLGGRPQEGSGSSSESDYGKVYGSRPTTGPTGPRSNVSSGSKVGAKGSRVETPPNGQNDALPPEIEDDLPF